MSDNSEQTADSDFDRQRAAMVAERLQPHGIGDARLLDAMRHVPRERFLPASLAGEAYDDTALPLDDGQSVTEPFIIARMIEALALGSADRVLEVGTGSGYSAAVMASIARRVYTIEHHRRLAEAAQARLAALGYDNVEVRCGNGAKGWREHAPFDAIVVTAACAGVPQALHDQLAVGGRLVLPLERGDGVQELARVRRVNEHHYVQEDLGAVRFVALIDDAVR